MNRGFTLVETMVATALFVVVMLVSVSTLLALVQANRKAQALETVVDNLNISLDGMARALRMGGVYHCASSVSLPLSPQDCPNGGSMLAFEPHGQTADQQPWIYRYNATTKRLEKSENGSAFISMTAPEVSIDSMQFYVVGSCPAELRNGYSCTPDQVQARVVAVITGTAPVPGRESTRATFHIQMTAVQRELDI